MLTDWEGGTQRPRRVAGDRTPPSGSHTSLEILRQAGVLKPERGVKSQSSVEAWLADFEYYLDHVAGCAPGSRGNYLRYARRFLPEVFGDQEIEWSRLTGDVVTEFVRRQAAKLPPSALWAAGDRDSIPDSLSGLERIRPGEVAGSCAAGSHVAALSVTENAFGA
jgi:hypothetical protein